MGLVKGLLTLPLAPYRGVLWIAERCQEAAEDEAAGASVTDRMRQLHEDHRAGWLTDDELADAEAALLDELAADADGRLQTLPLQRGGGEEER
jgi:hypothetical protein